MKLFGSYEKSKKELENMYNSTYLTLKLAQTSVNQNCRLGKWEREREANL